MINNRIRLVDVVTVKDWIPKITDKPCYLYDFNKMGITPKQFASVFVGRRALLFEKPFTENVLGTKCPWCDFRSKPKRKIIVGVGTYLKDHIFTHPGKTILSHQLVKFQKELYTLKLSFVRKGYHEAVPFFVEHSCQDCVDPYLISRNGMCSLPVSSRSRMRSLSVLGYPIDHLINNKKRKFKWSALGLIVLMKNELNDGEELL